MRLCPFCTQTLRDDATVCKHCTRAVVPVPVIGLTQPLTAAFLMPAAVLVIGIFTMLISAVPGAPRGMVLPGWLISWAGCALLLKGSGAVVRIGGGFILSLLMMGLAVSCNAAR